MLISPELSGVREVEEVGARLGRVDLHVLHVELRFKGEGVTKLLAVGCVNAAPHQECALREVFEFRVGRVPVHVADIPRVVLHLRVDIVGVAPVNHDHIVKPKTIF